MTHQQLNSVVVAGFTSIRSVTLTLRDLNVLVGANGAGKSNFIRALSTLGRIVDSELGLFVGLSGGANALLSIDKAVPRLIRLGVRSEAGEYTAELISAAGDALIFNDETIWVRDTNSGDVARPRAQGNRADHFRTAVGAGSGTGRSGTAWLPRVSLPRHQQRSPGEAAGLYSR